MRLGPGSHTRSRLRAGKARQAPVRRRRTAWRWRRRLAVLLVLALAGGAGALWRSTGPGWSDRVSARLGEGALALSRDVGLGVNEVLVEGRRRTDPARLLAALDIDRGIPILSVDPAAARERVEALGWVRRATVARRLPDLVYVRIEEFEPLALWQFDGRLSLIARDGEVIAGASPDAFAHLPLVVGEGAPEAAVTFLNLVSAYPVVASATAAAVLVSGRRWNLQLEGGIEARLPEDGVAAALGDLAELLSNQGLLERDVMAVDLRQRDRLIVRMRPDAAEQVRARDKST
ncbi:MAG: cell division protein FtsQ/DivIB [Alphaproteobacteria bacterium]